MPNGNPAGNPGKRPLSDTETEDIDRSKRKREGDHVSVSRNEYKRAEVDTRSPLGKDTNHTDVHGRNHHEQTDEEVDTSSDDSLEVVEERIASNTEPDFDLNDAFAEPSTATQSSSSVVDLSTQHLGDARTQEDQEEPTIVDLEAAEQQVIEISDDEEEEEEEGEGNQGVSASDRAASAGQESSHSDAVQFKAARDYRCPICFDPPDTALITPCGHIFCCDCLFQMVNSSRTQRRNGHCALCRKDVPLRNVRMVILRKKMVEKET